jgi:peptide/nickel transport system permease protein
MLQLFIFNINMSTNLIPNFPYHFRFDHLSYNYDPITGFLLLDTFISLDIDLFLDASAHIIPPAFALSWTSMAIIARMTRMAMVETMKQDFILLAKSKGLKEKTIIYRHALRNAIIPTLTVAGLTLAGLLTGSVLVETVFDWPGVGEWAVDAIFYLDLGAIMGFTIIVSILYVVSNLVVDILYVLIDPRISIE